MTDGNERMELTLNADQRLIASAAADLLAARRAEAGAHVVRESPAGYSTHLWQEIVDLDWPALTLPAQHGGLGFGVVELCLVLEELGRHQIPTPLLATACTALPIAEHGSESQRARWLGAVAEGHVLTYAGGHWDAEGSAVTISETPAGLRLDGVAEFVPYAGSAAALLVIAQHTGSDALSAILVDTASAGLHPQRLDVVGTTPEYRVDVTGVTVPADRVIGSIGDGAAVANTADTFGAVACCAEMVGGAQAVLGMTVRHATTRHQWNRPIGTFPAVQQHCADIAADVLGARLIASETIARAGTGPAMLDVSVAKAYVSDAYQRVCALAHQVHGAVGFTAEHELHQYTRHAMATALAFGDSYHHTAAVAAELGL